jgi:hypothetical protein
VSQQAEEVAVDKREGHYLLEGAAEEMKSFDVFPFSEIIPFVTLLDEKGRSVIAEITRCDWDGKSLLDNHGKFKWHKVHIEDDAIRPMYFCSEECRDSFNVKYPPGKECWPGIKLRVDGQFVELKNYV